MSQRPIYLDYMATTPVDPLVREKMVQCLDMSGTFGNPASSEHQYGWDADALVKQARQQVADLIHAEPREIIWTSGATESNNLAIKGAAEFYQNNGKHIITVKTEHKAVLDPCAALQKSGFDVTYLTPKSDGLIDLAELEAAIRPDTILISVMFVNNEIGVIQDMAAITALAKSHGVLVHSDCAQAAGKLPLDVMQLPIDLMSFSSHKVYGPKGMGALYVRRNPRVRLQAQIHGGGHEQGLRSGTLATHQIVGMGEAFAIASQRLEQDMTEITALTERLWHGISQLPGVHLNGSDEHRVIGNLNISFEGIDGEALILSMRELAVSSGSACNSANLQSSYVLQAIGVPKPLANAAVRFSVGRFTTEDEIDRAIACVTEKVTQLRRIAPSGD
ncbi:MAG: IscS subfamily cysteine desulfurase [Coxiellaceae bacterium]|nr:IscS subfamily cysteine desulfurase [Coxiellaceae bacterium]